MAVLFCMVGRSISMERPLKIIFSLFHSGTVLSDGQPMPSLYPLAAPLLCNFNFLMLSQTKYFHVEDMNVEEKNKLLLFLILFNTMRQMGKVRTTPGSTETRLTKSPELQRK